MKLQGFRVSNHPRLADADIEIRTHMVLVGANDVGKSSIIRCLDLLLGASGAQLYSRISPADFTDKSQPFIIEAVFGGLDSGDQARFPDEIDVPPVSSGESTLTVRLECTLDPDDNLTVRRYCPSAGHGRQMSRDQVMALSWRTIGSNSRARDVYDDRNAVLDDILRGIDLGTEQAIFDAALDAFGSALDSSVVLGSLRTQLAAQLSRALPETITDSDLRFEPGRRSDATTLGDVRMTVVRGGQVRNLTEQSDGTRALFAIALYDLVAGSANIVAVDEPEAHLHPTSQRSLAKLLRSGGNQKIIATHSSNVVAAFDTDQVVAVSNGGRIVQPQAGLLTVDEKLRLRWWTHSRLEPLTARKILAVEGLADRILLEASAEATARDLDRLGVSLVTAEGSGEMKAILTLFGPAGFRVPSVLLIDKDAEAKTAGYLGVPVTDLSQHHVWVCTPDLEGEYVHALGASAVWKAVTASNLFMSNELATCATSGPGKTRTDADVMAFCGGRRIKTRAAMAIVPLLNASAVANMPVISGALADVCGP